MINILVTGVGSLIAQGIIRTIKSSQLKIRIIGTDYFPHAVGLYWIDKGYILPDFLKADIDEIQWLEKVIDIIKTEKIEIVLIGLDFEVVCFAKNKKLIEDETNAKIIVGDLDIVNICNDKWKTAEFLKSNNLPFPNSCLPGDEEYFLQHNKFPLIIKPRSGFRSRDLYIVNNREEFDYAVKNCPKPVIQEIVGDIDQEYTCGTQLYDGKVISSISLRRDLKDGNTFRAFLTKECYKVNDFVKKAALILGLFGPANFQLRVSTKGPVIFEINPRFSGTTSIRTLFGCNEVEILIKAIRDNQMKVDYSLREGVVLRYFDEEFVSFNEYESWII